jgi:hypothetical protein
MYRNMSYACACSLSDAALSLSRQVSVRNSRLCMLGKIELTRVNAVTITAVIGCLVALAIAPAAHAQSAELLAGLA